jgi:hypothetical protein
MYCTRDNIVRSSLIAERNRINIVVVSDKALLYVTDTKDVAELNFDNAEFTGIDQELLQLTNLIELLYVEDSLVYDTKILGVAESDNVLKRILLTGRSVKEVYPQIQSIAYINTVSYADVKEILLMGICADVPLTNTIRELQRRKGTTDTNIYNEYTEQKVWYTSTHEIEVAEGTLSNIGSEIPQKIINTQEYDTLQQESKAYMVDVLAQADTSVLGEINDIGTNAYKISLTQSLLKQIQKTQRLIYAIRIDTIGYMFINDLIVNYKIPYSILKENSVNDRFWQIVLGLTNEEFETECIEKGCLTDEEKAEYINNLQDKHIVRWGYILDFTILTQLYDLRKLQLENIEILSEMQYVLTLKTLDELHLPYLNKDRYIVYGKTIKEYTEQQNQILKEVALLSNKVKKCMFGIENPVLNRLHV